MAKNSKNSLTQRTYLNAASSLVNYVATLLMGFVTSPVLLAYLGSSLFGTWKICQRLLTYVSAADGRATQALKWTIANKQSSDDVDAKQRDIGCAITVWLRFLPFILVVGALLAWFSPHLIRNLPSEHFIITRITCAILVLNLVLLPFRTIPEAAMIGMNLTYRCTWIDSFGTILGGVFMVAAAYIGWGLVGLATAVLFASLIRGFLIFLVARRSLLWLGISRPQKNEVRKFFSFSIWVFGWAFVNKFMLSSDIIILGIVASATKVTSYVLTYYGIQMALSLLTLLVSATIPGLGGVVGRKDFIKAAQVRGMIMTVSWLVTTVIGSMILLFNFSFVKLWVGPENFSGFTENIFMVLMMTQLIFIRNDAQIVDVTLDMKNKVLLGALSTCVSLFLGFYISSYLPFSNVVGLIIGLMAGRMILSISYPMLVRKSFNLKSNNLFMFIIRPLLVTTALYTSAAYIGIRLNIDGWISLIFVASVSFVLTLGLAYSLGLSKEQRKQVIIRLDHLGLPGFLASKARL